MEAAASVPGENPPVGLILCTHKDEAVAHYALEGRPVIWPDQPLGANVAHGPCIANLNSSRGVAV